MHPKVREFYDKSGLELILRSEDRLQIYTDAVTQGQPRSYHVDQIHRIKQGGYGEHTEFMWYYQTMKSCDDLGNLVTHFSIEGKYELPHATYQHDLLSKTNKAIGISHYETQYEIPFTPEALDQLHKDGKILDSKTTFYVSDGSTEYTVFDYNDFRNLSHAELCHIGRTGLRPNQAYEQVPTVKGAVKK